MSYSDWQPSLGPCYKCGSKSVEFRTWESSDGAYEDYNYRCKDCKYDWWVDGIDS